MSDDTLLIEEPAGETPPATDPPAVLQSERDEYLDMLRRVQADFENFRAGYRHRDQLLRPAMVRVGAGR